jgi:pyruvate dehydrogenase E1 component
MYRDGEDIFYYLTLYNENYLQPPKPDGVDEGIRRGIYRFAPSPDGAAHRAAILFSGSAHRAARSAQLELAEHYGVGADLFSATNYKLLREEALAVERWNRLHPGEQHRVPYVTTALAGTQGPIVAVSDFMKMVPDQVARWVPRRFIPLGTDGFGRSDTREALRRFFEVDTGHVVVATLSGLAEQGRVDPAVVKDAIARYDIDPDVGDPRTR